MAQIYPTGTSVAHMLTDNTFLVMYFNSSGQEITTGIQVLSGTTAQIVEQCDLIMNISSSGVVLG